jgi:hypothetical protein
MTNDPEKPIVELGIEFFVELLLFLYPYGADQMGLPHDFWLGLACWIGGTAIAIRMFWIFPMWSKRLTRLEKGLVSFIVVAAFALLLYRPVTIAYRKRGVDSESKVSPPKTAMIPEQSQASNVVTTLTPLPAQGEPQKKGITQRQSTRDNSPAIQQQGQNNIAQIGNNNQATINPEPPERNWNITHEDCNKLLAPIRTAGKLDVALAHFISDADGANVVGQLSRCLPNVRDWKISTAVVPPVPEGVTVVTSQENREVAETLEQGLSSIGFNTTIKIIPNAPDVEVWIGKHAFKQRIQQ